MFRKLDLPLTGLVINNSYFICPGCEERHYLFGGNPNDEENAFSVYHIYCMLSVDPNFQNYIVLSFPFRIIGKGVKAMGMGGDKVVGELPLVKDVGHGGESGVPFALRGQGAAEGPGEAWQIAMKKVAERVWKEISDRTS